MPGKVNIGPTPENISAGGILVKPARQAPGQRPDRFLKNLSGLRESCPFINCGNQ